MRYAESSTKSAELLRLVLPRIAQHGGHYSPTSYSVWYEYLSGVNPALARAVDPALVARPEIEQPTIDRFYFEHIQCRDVQQSEQLQAAMVSLMGKLLAP